MKRRAKNRYGFSLMELLAVVTILGLLAALIVPRMSINGDAAKIKSCMHDRAEINITVEQYYLNTGNWPANDLSDIGSDVSYFPNGPPACPLTGALYRLDPATHRVVGHAGNSDHSP